MSPRRKLFVTHRRLVTAAAIAAAAAAASVSVDAASVGASGSVPRLAPVGIVSADPTEQAGILAEMHVDRGVVIAGYADTASQPRTAPTPP